MLATMQIFVPSTIDRDTPMTPELHRNIVRDVIDRATNRFGGATEWMARGSFLASDGRIIREPITVVTIGYDLRSSGSEDWLRRSAASIAGNLGQESVTVIIDGMMEFIRPDHFYREHDSADDERPASVAFAV